MKIKPWRELYEADCDESETGFAPWAADSYMQDEIDELHAALAERDKLLLDIEAAMDGQPDAVSLGYDIECRMAAIKDEANQ